MSVRKIPLLVLLILLLLVGCRPKTEPTPEATQTPEPAPLDVTYCDIEPSDMCLEGFGLNNDDRLLILFKANDFFFANIYIRADGPDGEILFECQQSEHFLENVYCLGDPYPDGEPIKLNIYSKGNDRLIALGVFDVQYSSLPARDVFFEADATATPALTPSYSNPSYSNPSYPNPTSTP